jgi:hypothetical protein
MNIMSLIYHTIFVFTIAFIFSFLGLFITLLRNNQGFPLKILAATSGISLTVSCLLAYIFRKTMMPTIFFMLAGFMLIAGFILDTIRKRHNISHWLFCIIYIFPFYFIFWPDINPVAHWIVLLGTITSVLAFFDRIREDQTICNIFLFSFLFFLGVSLIINWNGLFSIFTTVELVFRYITLFSFYWFLASKFHQEKYTQNMLRILIVCISIYCISIFMQNFNASNKYFGF